MIAFDEAVRRYHHDYVFNRIVDNVVNAFKSKRIDRDGIELAHLLILRMVDEEKNVEIFKTLHGRNEAVASDKKEEQEQRVGGGGQTP